MKSLLGGLALVGLVVLIFQFTNCSSYSSSDTFTGASTLSCTTTNCIVPNPTIVKVTANLANGEYDVPGQLAEFNIGGDCNEGGYPTNYIRWDLIDPNTGLSVRNSTMPVAQGATANSMCINGRFMIYVFIGNMTSYCTSLTNCDTVDRTGLKSATGGCQAYNLNITIYGQMNSSDPAVYSNHTTSVPLQAFSSTCQ